MKSILQDWVTELGLRHQGVLVTAIRGCDGMAKEDVTKPLARELRGLVLVPYDDRELDNLGGFMVRFPSEPAAHNFNALLRSLDHYPVHYLFHLIHAVEIIGYYHPNRHARAVYFQRYENFVRRLHLRPETMEQMDSRLTEDRIMLGTVGA